MDVPAQIPACPLAIRVFVAHLMYSKKRVACLQLIVSTQMPERKQAAGFAVLRFLAACDDGVLG